MMPTRTRKITFGNRRFRGRIVGVRIKDWKRSPIVIASDKIRGDTEGEMTIKRVVILRNEGSICKLYRAKKHGGEQILRSSG
jgi:hypothetical protein